MEFFKKLFSGSNNTDELIKPSNDEEVDALVRAHLSKEHHELTFTLVNEQYGFTLYATQLCRALNNKYIPKTYHLLMKGFDIYLVKADMVDGEILMKVPDKFEVPDKYISPLSFNAYKGDGLTVSLFLDYHGLY